MPLEASRGVAASTKKSKKLFISNFIFIYDNLDDILNEIKFLLHFEIIFFNKPISTKKLIKTTKAIIYEENLRYIVKIVCNENQSVLYGIVHLLNSHHLLILYSDISTGVACSFSHKEQKA